MISPNQFDLAVLNREYSPSSCIDNVDICIQKYIRLSKDAMAKAKKNGKVYTDLQYGDKKSQRLDLFIPTQTLQKSLIVYIHGGYWQELSKEESSFAATNFQQHGCHFAVINYTLVPNASLTEIVQENCQAIAWLYTKAEKYGYQSEKIYVCGSSAGAHLAMMMLQTNWSDYIMNYNGNIIKGVCAISGIYDLLPLVRTYINDRINMDIEEARKNSPLILSLPSDVPIIITFGDNETSAFKHQSNIMYDKLINQGFDVKYKEIIGRNHFDVVLDLCDRSSWIFTQTIALTTR